jgi:beta-lactamase class A
MMTTTMRVTDGAAGAARGRLTTLRGARYGTLRGLAALGAALSLGAPAAAQRPAASPDPGLARLEASFAELAKVTDGTVGVAVVHLESGRAAYLNRGERFPMASTVKVPLAVQLLTRVDRREVRLDSMITLRPGDLHPGSGTLTELFNQPGVALSVRNLMELMLRISDNSATDVLLRTAGGAPAVNARLAAIGVSGVRADRPTVRLIADYIGVQNLPGDDVPIAEFARLSRAVSDSGRGVALAAFALDPRDTSTPEGMAVLLEKIWRRQAVSAASGELLLDIMYRCVTGAERIKGMLPPDTRVAHKTGSLAPSEGIRGGRTVNDVGIIDLPDGAGHLVLVAFVKGADDAARGERAIAHVARAAYDYFTLTPAPAAAAPDTRPR